jgi:hypothetical protein
MRRILQLFIVLMMCPMALSAQAIDYESADSLFVVDVLKNAPAEPLYFARQLMGRPYVAHTLEVNAKGAERLVVNTRQLDCTTLVENVVALTLCAQHDERTFADFTRYLQQLRYRQGMLDGYPSRLHYFSDWIDDKTAMGFVSEVQQNTAPFTAVQTLNINYMSQHPQAYDALKAHPAFVDIIAQQEKQLSGRQYRYIPKAMVKNTQTLRQAVHDGDIIAITCSKPGLDIAHLGFAVWRTDGLHLLNASLLHKKVVEEPMTMGQYLKKHSSHTGIRVVRISEK